MQLSSPNKPRMHATSPHHYIKIRQNDLQRTWPVRCGGGFSETIYFNYPGVILREPRRQQWRKIFFAGSSTCENSLRENAVVLAR